MTKCCGEFRSSAFCPECGSKLAYHDLNSLLTHLTARVKQPKERLKELADLDGIPEQDRPVWYRSEAARFSKEEKQKKIVEKWDRWIECVTKAIELTQQENER